MAEYVVHCFVSRLLNSGATDVIIARPSQSEWNIYALWIKPIQIPYNTKTIIHCTYDIKHQMLWEYAVWQYPPRKIPKTVLATLIFCAPGWVFVATSLYIDLLGKDQPGEYSWKRAFSLCSGKSTSWYQLVCNALNWICKYVIFYLMMNKHMMARIR